MIFTVVLSVVIVSVITFVVMLYRKQSRLIQRVAKMAMKVADLEMTVNRVDDSTGTAIHELRNEFYAFRQDYGDAAIDQMREEAKAQKAFTDGLNGIMSFGAGLNGRGDST